MTSAWIVSSGTELTLGQSVDTNSAWLAARLAAVGVRTARHLTVPDDSAALQEIVTAAAGRVDLLLITGGLGPTEDDLTRQAVAGALGVGLVRHEPCVEQMRAFFARRGRELPERNLIQAMLPDGAAPIENTCGTAPGFVVVHRGTTIIAMPGVPFEMKRMYEAGLEPRLVSASGGAVIRTRTLHTIGMPEAELGAAIADLMRRGANPEVGTTAELGIIGVRINATAPTVGAATRVLDETEAEIRRRLGPIVFGRDGQTLAAATGELLAARGVTVAVAESCTGGLLGALLTETPGSSRYFRGGVLAYANEAKRDLLGVPEEALRTHGAVSAVVAEAMARGAADRLRADYALAITGVAGPDGGTPEKPVGLVYLGLATPTSVAARELRLGEDATRPAIRTRSARLALDWLRTTLATA